MPFGQLAEPGSEPEPVLELGAVVGRWRAVPFDQRHPPAYSFFPVRVREWPLSTRLDFHFSGARLSAVIQSSSQCALARAQKAESYSLVVGS